MMTIVAIETFIYIEMSYLSVYVCMCVGVGGYSKWHKNSPLIN